MTEWTKSPLEKRRSHVEYLLEGLEHKDALVRFTNSRRLFYIVQGDSSFHFASFSSQIPYTGAFAETSSPEHQLHWIVENCKLVRSANGVSTILDALKIASSKHDLLMQVNWPSVLRLY